MKKLFAILLSIVLVFAFSVSAFAAGSPVAKDKVTVVLRIGDGIKGALEADGKYTVDGGAEISVVANEKEHGTFTSWTIYKVVGENKTELAVENVDYEIIKGGLKLKELSFLAHADIIVCANYGDVITDPLSSSTTSGTQTDESPETRDKAGFAIFALLTCGMVAYVAKKKIA